MLEDHKKRIKLGEKMIEANYKKVETYNSMVDQIPGAPQVQKGVDSMKFVQKPFPSSAALKPIPKKFRMPNLLKYNTTSDPNEHVTAYTCAIKGNDLKDDEIEFVLLKKFGETLSKGAIMWYHNLSRNSIDSFTMLADSFIKAHAGAIKVATQKSDVYKIKQRENEMLREFVSRFQMEGMELPPVFDDWAVHTFTQCLNERISVASKQLKLNLVEYPAVTWSDVHNRYQSKIRVEEDQLGAPSGSVYPRRLLAKEPKPNKERRHEVQRLTQKAIDTLDESSTIHSSSIDEVSDKGWNNNCVRRTACSKRDVHGARCGTSVNAFNIEGAKE
ncbi:uncharacterized protein [Nicotiana sylvestris]|uniref:uncharacterized protein n=1 Tax=Nicotiana sylvestris TaxID=4096 RepID=UPI00388C49B9